MSSKRVLDLERAKEKVKRLKASIKEEEERFAVYLREELAYYMIDCVESVTRVRVFGVGNTRVNITFENGCELRVPPLGEGEVPKLFIGNTGCLWLYHSEPGFVNEDSCHLETCLLSDEGILYRLTTLVAVLPDARRIVRDIIPEWRVNPPNAEDLMTTRVLHWTAKQYEGHHQLADVITGTLIKMIH
jgi:hypothetical protein